MALQATKHERWSEPPATPLWRRMRAPAWTWMLLALVGWGMVSAVALVAAMERRRAEHIAQLAGMTNASGRGVEIILSDSRQPALSGVHLAGRTTQAPQANQAVVTDGDLILLNMLLWYGGTRAVAINNQRIIAQTTIISSGPVILINGTRIVGPFRIAALGDPDTLKDVLAEAGLIEQMRNAGITVRMSAQPNLIVPPWQPGTETAR